MTRVEERGLHILEIFVQSQARVHDKYLTKLWSLLESVKRHKDADNAEQHKNRQCNRVKREARNALRKARRGAPVKPRCKDDAERLARRRARQRAYKERLAERKAAAA